MKVRLLLVAVAVAYAPAATAQELGYTGSLQMASGSYIFTEPTRTFSLYNGLSLQLGRLRVSGGIPLILQNSGAVTVVGGTYLPTGGTESGAVGRRQSGQTVPMHPGGPQRAVLALEPASAAAPMTPTDSVVEEPGSYALTLGDPLVSAGVELYRGFGLVRGVEIRGGAKLPFTDLDSGVGTGQLDTSAGASLVLGVRRVLLFLDATYWWYGDLPELELANGVSWSGGAAAPLGARVSVLAVASRSNRIIPTAAPAASAAVGLSYRLDSGASLSLTAGTGLSETAAGFTFALGWSRSYGRPR